MPLLMFILEITQEMFEMFNWLHSTAIIYLDIFLFHEHHCQKSMNMLIVDGDKYFVKPNISIVFVGKSIVYHPGICVHTMIIS